MYGGFFLDSPVGNNRFSYDERSQKSIYVPALIDADIKDIEISELPSFVEIEDGVENICYGLKNIYKINSKKYPEKEIYLFDNHNHSFFFWCKGILDGKLDKGINLLHVDQHKDTRVPEDFDVDISDLNDVSRYVNEVLNVGSFIVPAMEMGIFDNLQIVDSTYTLNEEVKLPYALDLDLDFFSEDMDYIDYDYKLSRVIEYVEKTDFITVATSPYFINQEKALDVFREIFG